jgi:hypothetical protein
MSNESVGKYRVRRVRSWPIKRYHPGIGLERERKNTRLSGYLVTQPRFEPYLPNASPERYCNTGCSVLSWENWSHKWAYDSLYGIKSRPTSIMEHVLLRLHTVFSSQ